MNSGREQVLGSFALLAVTAILIWNGLPSGIPREPDIPLTIEKPGTVAVEIAGESDGNGVYFIPRGTTVAAFLYMAGIVAADGSVDAQRAGALRSATTIHLLPTPPGISVQPMAAQKRLALGIPIDINRSSLEDLVLVPGIGEKTAGKIVEERGLNGTFIRLEELLRVNGIKEKHFEKIRRYLCIAC